MPDIPTKALPLIVKAAKSPSPFVIRSFWGEWEAIPYVRPYTPTTSGVYYVVSSKGAIILDPLTGKRKVICLV